MKIARFLVCPLLALALAGNALAEWSQVARFEDDTVVYVDAARAYREGDTARVPHLVRWGEPQVDPGMPAYRSTIVLTVYDCVARRERYLGSASYAGPMGDGAQVLADDNEAESWYSISVDSMEERLWRIACAAKPARSAPVDSSGEGQ